MSQQNSFLFLAENYASLNTYGAWHRKADCPTPAATEEVCSFVESHGECTITDVRAALGTISELMSAYQAQPAMHQDDPVAIIGGFAVITRLLSETLEAAEEMVRLGSDGKFCHGRIKAVEGRS